MTDSHHQVMEVRIGAYYFGDGVEACVKRGGGGNGWRERNYYIDTEQRLQRAIRMIRLLAEMPEPVYEKLPFED